MGGAAIFHDAKPAGGYLVLDPMIEQESAIGNVFLQALAGERSLASLPGDDCGQLALLEPVEQAADFGSQDCGV